MWSKLCERVIHEALDDDGSSDGNSAARTVTEICYFTKEEQESKEQAVRFTGCVLIGSFPLPLAFK